MRTLLAFLLMAPLLAQQPADQQAKPADQVAAPDQKADPQKAADQKSAEAAPAAENPAPPTEPWFTGSVDLGYRWLINQQGNAAEYQSVVNLGHGPRLFGLDFTGQDPNKRLFDRIDARASGWGGDPYSLAHLGVLKRGIYDFTADYRDIAYFDAVPSFANPFQPAGFNEQSFNLHYHLTNISLDLLPGHRVTPYLAYERNSDSGNGISTWVQQSNDEFAVPSMFRDSTNNYRGGVRVELNRFHLTLEQGGTQFRNDDSAYNSVQNPGNNLTPLLGQNLYLNTLTQTYGIRGSGLYDKVLVTASPAPWIDLYGQFLYSYPKTTVSYTDVAQGNFANLSSLLFYTTDWTMAAGQANAPHVTGNAGFEMRPLKRLRIIESLTTDRYHDAASPLVTEQLLGTGFSQNLLTALNYHQVVNYNQQEVDLIYDPTNRITLRGGYRAVWGDATVLAGRLSQTGNLVTGNLRRNIGLAGATFRPIQKMTVTLDYQGGLSDNIYFRTSLNNYNKGSALAKYQITGSLTAQVRLQVLDNQNPDPSIRYDFLSRDNAVSLFWTPEGGKRITVMGEYDRSTLRSDIRYLGLFFIPSVSDYRDNAHTATSAVSLALPGYPKAKLTFGGSLFISSGSRPTRYYQPLARLSVPIQKHIDWNTEWQWYGYGEAFYLFEGFRTHIFQTGVRIKQ